MSFISIEYQLAMAPECFHIHSMPMIRTIVRFRGRIEVIHFSSECFVLRISSPTVSTSWNSALSLYPFDNMCCLVAGSRRGVRFWGVRPSHFGPSIYSRHQNFENEGRVNFRRTNFHKSRIRRRDGIIVGRVECKNFFQTNLKISSFFLAP